MKKLKNFELSFKYTKDLNNLSFAANQITEKYFSNKVYLRALVEFSNYCIQNCLYCGIRRDNNKINRYRIPIENIKKIITNGAEKGFKTFVLQSGEDPYYKIDNLIELVDWCKTKYPDVAITLSLGIKRKNEYALLKKYGADRYLIRFEISDEKLHKFFRDGVSLTERIRAIEDLINVDFEIGSGFMVGLPFETPDIFYSNIELCKKLKLDMVGIGPYIPHPDTPLFKIFNENINKNKCKKDNTSNLVLSNGHVFPDMKNTLLAVSLLRINLPYSNIPATTAMGTLDPFGREKALLSGANVLMPNITPETYKPDYQLYPDKICIDESGFECVECLNFRVKKIGKEISMEKGTSISYLTKLKS